MSTLPQWAQVVEALSERPLTQKQLNALGVGDESIHIAEQQGHITRLPKNGKVFYNPTYKGKRSYSVVKTNQILQYSRATTSVATPPKGPPRESYVPPRVVTARPGADEFKNIPSRGL